MDNQAPASPASSTSGSDSDNFNSESARVYFGPMKTPERHFVAANNLFPPPVPSPLRRSPRLSSPRPPSNLQSEPREEEAESTAQETEDIELVAQLVNEVEVDDDDDEEMDGSRSSTPQKGDLVPDEPSSALASRILLAMDNPSPPPSPPAALKMFDPYHTTSPKISRGYQQDLLVLNGTIDGPLLAEDNPLGPQTVLVDARRDMTEREELLISLDTPDNSITLDVPQSSAVPATPRQVLSVDDMFAQSPDVQPSPPKANTEPAVHAPSLVLDDVHPTEEENKMVVDSPKPPVELDPPPEVTAQGEQTATNNPTSQPEPESPPPPPATETPLRRSSRPRKSLLPTPVQQAPPPVFIQPSSAARTSVRRKSGLVKRMDEDEVVADSEDERDKADPSRISPVRAALAARQRSRSPSKEPPVFRRELGSLSPKSSDLLAALAFGRPGPSTLRSSYEPAPVFSFSALSEQSSVLEPINTPSTPIQHPPTIDGPRRIPSPTKAEASPSKFRLQHPTSDNPLNTPPRRITMEQAIASGQLSPQKAAQLGWKPTVTTTAPSASTAVSTPARRVLISEKQPIPPAVASKATLARPSSPAKFGKSISRERSPQPPSHLKVSIKGKERAISPAAPASTAPQTPRPLPFPIVATPSRAPITEQDTIVVNRPPTSSTSALSPKSGLKQVSSRIPRINAKPYARSVEPKAKKVDSTKAAADAKKGSSSNTVTRRSIRKVEDATKPEAPVAKTKDPGPVPSQAAALKRKREEKPISPVKPRVIREVPGLRASASTKAATTSTVTTTTTTTTTTVNGSEAKGKKSTGTGGTIRIRRVVSPPLPPKPPSPPLEPPATTTLDDEPQEPPVEVGSTQLALAPPETQPLQAAPSSPPPMSHELPPGSPMKQDSRNHAETEDMDYEPTPSQTPQTPPRSMIPAPAIVIEPPAPPPQPEPVSSGLRRTTRQRRSTSLGSEPATTSRTTTRRKVTPTFHSDDVFSGMSITALKELTTSNTNKNQHYLAIKLETEVIKKDGLRPESPVVKIRTIQQRQQEDKEKEREERAQRRARRSLAKSVDGVVDFDENTASGSEDAGYSSPLEGVGMEEVGKDGDGDWDMEDGGQIEEDDESGLPRHTRGAGEEEDYETPERPLRGIKARLFDDGTTAQEQRRRVKWDRGLFTTVYLDEVQLGSRQTLKENRDLKGILAPAAKALRLDTLGNLVPADTPLGDLVQENVTVKKFVYDNDVVAVPEPTPPPVPKTRSKGKRK